MLIVTTSVPLGVNVELLFAKKSPVTVRLLLMVVVPVPAPTEIVVPAPPKLIVEAVAFNKLKDPDVVVKSPPLTATSPAVVTFPVKVDIPSIVNAPFAWIFPVFESVVPVDP